MALTLDNFVRATLQADAAIDATTLAVTKAAAPLRDPPDASAQAPGLLVLQDVPTSPTQIEIVTYTGRAINGTIVTLTGVARAQEGTSAYAWTAGTPTFQGITASALASKLDAGKTAVDLGYACSDETTALTTGVKVTDRAPRAMTLTGVKASLTTASTSGVVTIDVKVNGVSIFSTTLTIDVAEKTSATAAVPAVLLASPTAIADDDEITISIVGAGSGAKGLKVHLLGTV